MASTVEAASTARTRAKYVPAVGPRLRWLLTVVFVLFAILAANSVYLLSVTALEALSGETYQNYFYQYMFLAHLALGVLLIGPFVVFAAIHVANTRQRKNRRALRAGYALLAASVVLLLSGVMLMRLGDSAVLQLREPLTRSIVYWLHVVSPLAVGWLYWLHRLAGPKIKWRVGMAYTGVVGAACAVMLVSHRTDPRAWFAVGPSEGEQYFRPSLARTATGSFIPAEALMNDAYCMECHADVHAQWSDSVHRFSSFNNPAYLASVRETREFSLKKQGDVKRARWCAGCHDPVPFFSGAFDDPHYDDVSDPTAQQGITCSVCHAVTNVNSTRGNADYTIEEPLQYPFAFSDNPVLKWANRQMIKAKPEFHKKTFLKPFHRTAEFCSTCHKVHLPEELNDYKFVRGQNHYDPFLLSGVSGHRASAFYYPPKSKENCASCHMPLVASEDFGAKRFDGAEELSVHDHLFPAANTAIAHLRGKPDVVAAHQEFLKGSLRADIFALREGGDIDGKLFAPLRPRAPTLVGGRKYLLDVVLRTLKVGHLFTQGTVDSNEVWLDVTVQAGDRVVGRLGAIGDDRAVDPWTHFVNVFMLDREGNRIDRRNPQDIFVPLYNNQIPPGAAHAIHLGLDVPPDVQGVLSVEVKLQYRKFDARYMDYVTRSAKEGDLPIRGHKRGEPYVNDLPVTTICTDRIEFHVAPDGAAEVPAVVDAAAPATPEWERWNDYGIGLLLKGNAELKQAAEAFAEVERLGRFDGSLNLARVYYAEGDLDTAVAAISRATAADPPAPPWTVAWLSGLINRQQGRLAEAERNFRSVLEDRTPAMIDRSFDFSFDYDVINLLGETLFDRAKALERDPTRQLERERLLREAAAQFEKTLQLDTENVAAHYNLGLLYKALGDAAKSAEHAELHERYKPDDNARDLAIAKARKRYPAADRAAEKVVIYSLHRGGAGLPAPTTSAAVAEDVSVQGQPSEGTVTGDE